MIGLKLAEIAQNEDDEFGNKELGSKERRKYIKELKKVIEVADVRKTKNIFFIKISNICV